MTQEEIKKVLEKHQHWLMQDVDEWEQMRADLRRADLRKADLTEADLDGADLGGADLRGADLGGAYLRKADLTGADLTGADLDGADLTGADLGGAYLTGAYISGAVLTMANLRGANLDGAFLTGGNLKGAKNLNMPMACPTHGSFIGWKKAINPEDHRALLVKLLIPDDARRSSATTSKCRCDKAQVLEITDLDGNAFEKAYSKHDKGFVYKIGETVKVKDFCTDRFDECAAGIHFFVDREAAVMYRA